MSDVWKLDACAQADLVRKGEVTPAELIQAAIGRIDRLNPTLNALVSERFDRALAEADRGIPDGPFRGVPLVLKDFLCETAGDPCWEGSQWLRNVGWRSRADSQLATRFRHAGFVILGRTNVPEFAASATTEPAAFGPTRNPWNPARSAGGSSGGSAAAVASGMVPVAHANDGTGSIRIPAAACGLVGLRPSRGRNPSAEAGDLGNVVEHVVARSVRDAAAVLDAVSGAARSGSTAPPLSRRPFREEVGASVAPLRIGFLTHDPLLLACRTIRPAVRYDDVDSAAAVADTVRVLESLGHVVTESHPAALDGRNGLGAPRGIIAAVELAARIDAWTARAGRGPAPNELEPATWAMVSEGREYSASDVAAARQRLLAGVAPIRDWWKDGFDLLLTPTTNGLPPHLGAFAALDLHERSWRLAEAFGLYTVPYSFTGQPAISLPATRVSGLPIGVQLVADHGREDLLIAVAAQLEEARPWADRWPPIS